METGVKSSITVTVTGDMTARAAGSGDLAVFSTPDMIALIEKTCCTSVGAYLEEGQSTVGTKIDVEHVSATPVGMKVTAECELIEIDGRRLVFKVEARDEAGVIGRGTHERFIIRSDSFVKKTYSKLEN